MKPLLVYICAVHYRNSMEYFRRFVESYINNPPGAEHYTVIVANGGPFKKEHYNLFDRMGECTYHYGDNIGYDLGAYISISRDIKYPSNTMFCCGTSLYFKKPGWLKRLLDVWDEYGPSIYGTLSTHQIRPHIRTTGFLVPKFMLFTYPHPTITLAQRYNFEHGEESICWWARILKHRPLVVSWMGVHDWQEWENIPLGYRKGNQSNCLCYDSHSDRSGYQ